MRRIFQIISVLLSIDLIHARACRTFEHRTGYRGARFPINYRERRVSVQRGNEMFLKNTFFRYRSRSKILPRGPIVRDRGDISVIFNRVLDTPASGERNVDKKRCVTRDAEKRGKNRIVGPHVHAQPLPVSRFVYRCFRYCLLRFSTPLVQRRESCLDR